MASLLEYVCWTGVRIPALYRHNHCIPSPNCSRDNLAFWELHFAVVNYILRVCCSIMHVYGIFRFTIESNTINYLHRFSISNTINYICLSFIDSMNVPFRLASWLSTAKRSNCARRPSKLLQAPVMDTKRSSWFGDLRPSSDVASEDH